MSEIESGDPEAFDDYLSKYGNTICGRHAIAIMLHVRSRRVRRTRRCVFVTFGQISYTRVPQRQALRQVPQGHKITFNKYDQSSKCMSMHDSSVSYASALISASL